MLGLLQWHFWYAPHWLVMLTINLERVAARYFSAGLMLRTLISHWHKDAVSYNQGTMSKIALALAWNAISRAIGFAVRLTVLTLYLVVAISVGLLGALAVTLFYLWPLLAGASIFMGLRILEVI